MDLFAGHLCTEALQPSTCPAISSLLMLLEKTPALMWATDLQPFLTTVTGAGLHAIGASANGYVGQPVDVLFQSAKSNQKVLRAHRNALKGVGSAFEVEVDGHSLEAHVEPIRGTDGSITGVIGVALDVTDRLVAQRALRLSEQSYRSLIDEAPYAICRATQNGQLLQINPAMLAMLGYDPASGADLLVRDLPLIFVSPESFDAFREELLRGNTLQGFDSTWLRRDGQKIQVRLGGRAIRDVGTKLLYFDLLAENVTERKELETRLFQAQKMQAIGQLAGGVAHDFNNLLTVINGYCDLLLMAGDSDGLHREKLEMIRQAGERATGLTQQLLAFSRKQVTQIQPVLLNAVVSEVVQLSRRLIGENIELEEQLGATAGQVLADAAQIHQMLMNLVINARDAMADGGRLSVSTCGVQVDLEMAHQLDVTSGAYARLVVSDCGVGMNDHVRAHLFEPFFTTKPAGKGTGLGLATVYGVVRQTRGAIAVESQAGVGTTFTIYLPQYVSGESPSESSPKPPALLHGASTVLVVEDEGAVRHFTVEVLTGAGYEVLQAANAEEALVLAERYAEPIHLLLTDMVMPGISGRKLVERLHPLHPEAKVVLVSGYSETLSATNALDPGIRYLQKPFTPEQLTRIVNEVLSSQE